MARDAGELRCLPLPQLTAAAPFAKLDRFGIDALLAQLVRQVRQREVPPARAWGPSRGPSSVAQLAGSTALEPTIHPLPHRMPNTGEQVLDRGESARGLSTTLSSKDPPKWANVNSHR